MPVCRYLLATSETAVYVAFMGTKAVRDLLTDVNYVQAKLWPGLKHTVRTPQRSLQLACSSGNMFL